VRPLKLLVWTIGLVLGAVALSACGIGGLSPIFPEPVSPNGADIYRLYQIISIPAIIIFLGVEIALIWVIVKYRRSRHAAGYVPPQVHGNTKLEIVWTIIPLIVVLAIAGGSFYTLQKNFQPIDPSNYTIVVSGHQFGWNYSYPEGFTIHQEGTLTGDVPPMVVPTHKLIRLQFEGTDVIHSWWVPAITGKTDAVPGYDNFSWMKIDQDNCGAVTDSACRWRGECAELCGTGHATMQIIVKAVDQATFDQWVQQQKGLTQSSPSPSPS
jgi:cytochrome c oxidase subunit 2